MSQPFRRIGAIQMPQRKLLALLILLAFPATHPQPLFADPSPPQDSRERPLPDLTPPAQSSSSSPSQTRIRPSVGGINLDSNDVNSRFSANATTSQLNGASLGVRGALAITDNAALGGGVQAGGNLNELYLNLGLRLGENQRLMFTGGQLRQKLDFNFRSGNSQAEMTQNSAGASWRLNLGNGLGLFDYAEANAYAARTNSRDLGSVTYAIDTATLFELWSGPRRIAGGRITGLQGRLGLKPWDSGRLNLGLGQERLQYDLQNGEESHNRATGSINLEQGVGSQTRLKIGADAAAAQNRYSFGLDFRTRSIGTLGLDYVNIHGRDNMPNDNRVQLSWTMPLGKNAGGVSATSAASAITSAANSHPRTPPSPQQNSPRASQSSQSTTSLLDQVVARPEWMPSQAIAKRDTTATPTRLIAIDKTALPPGAAVTPNTAAITAPLGAVATGIAGVTLNGAPFSNSGQFALAGDSLVVNPNLIAQPAIGVVDTYVVTINNPGDATTLATVKVSHGSVKIDSIVMSPGIAAAAPTASSVSISGNAQVGQTLTGSYIYADANSDPQGATTFRWLRNGVAIAGATASTYTLVATDQGKAITFEVTPVSTVAPTSGTPVASTATASVAGAAVAAAAPTASAVSISGSAQVGQTLTGSYTYADANSDPQGTTTFRWLRNGAAIAGATASTYTLVAADQSNTITFEVTPVSTVAPTSGTPVASTATASVAGAAVAATAPTASAVSISGTAQVGQTLAGSYTYADANSDPQGASTFRWLRGGVAIAGATASSYTLVVADQGSTISFEVTPVSAVAPTTGTAVVSTATASVTGAGVAAAPTASSVSISGSAQVGQTLTGSYTYADANSDPQGATTFRWLRGGVAIAGATASTYVLVAADQGTSVTFEVTPVATIAPTGGVAVVSGAVALAAAPAIDTAPTLVNAGDTCTEDAVCGTYNNLAAFAAKMGYADAENNAITSMTFTIPAGMNITIGGAVQAAGVVTYTAASGVLQFNGNGTPGTYNMTVVANNANGSSIAKTYTETVTDLRVGINNIANRSGEQGAGNIVFNAVVSRSTVEFANNAALQAAASVSCVEGQVTGVAVTGANIADGTVSVSGNPVNSGAAATSCTVRVMDDGVQSVSNVFTLSADPAIPADTLPVIANTGDACTEDAVCATYNNLAAFATKMGYSDAENDAITSMTLTIPVGMNVTIGGVLQEPGVVNYTAASGVLQFNGNGGVRFKLMWSNLALSTPLGEAT